ncbi:hypothetical protein PHLGIDRAFT_131042 [Phlebiopsis gigantea 11061_1 CR5-6]|uniref:Peptidase A1 domain-containing protein n=1 Tax=Phlebiopsis gigantea (strain 11061_1 CR5-6) TaxID=745531 RepID=A0A0C3S2L3_PHLG1|nr:hypothetical protein PHLGIDRAFT_131042 [Phlebiopsis gigantea 11061_1 CR5-6]
MRLLSFLSVLAATSAISGASWTRRALTQANLDDFAENIIITQESLPGFFVEIDVGGNEVLVQVDFQSADLFVTGQLKGADSFPASTAEASINYSFFGEPVADVASILQTNVSIGAKTIQQAFAFDANFTIQDITEAFPLSPATGVLGFGPSPLSAVFNGLKTGHSPIDTLIATNATSPYVTIFFVGSESFNQTSSDPSFAGFFTVGEPVPLPDILPPANGLSAPDVSNIHNQTAIPLGIDNSFTVQSIAVGSTGIPLNSSVSGTSASTSVGILSSVSPWILVPQYIAQAIYGTVDGAAFDSTTGLWHTPCGTNVTVSVAVADSTVVLNSDSVVITLPGTSQCVGSFKVTSQPDQNWDISFGTAFLENVYVLLGYTSTDLTEPIMKLLPYADIQGIEAYESALNSGDNGTATSTPQTSTPGPSTRFTTVTVTHTPTTTVVVGGPSSTSTVATSVTASPITISASASASSSSATGGFAGALDVESSDGQSSDNNANELKIYKITTYALAGVAGALLIGLLAFCIASRRRKSGIQHSAYRNLHTAESADHSRALYGHDEESSKYSDPYQDRM